MIGFENNLTNEEYKQRIHEMIEKMKDNQELRFYFLYILNTKKEQE